MIRRYLDRLVRREVARQLACIGEELKKMSDLAGLNAGIDDLGTAISNCAERVQKEVDALSQINATTPVDLTGPISRLQGMVTALNQIAAAAPPPAADVPPETPPA